MADSLQVVMLPWSAFGHLLPFFRLSLALAKLGVHVSFVSTPRNVQRLPKIPSNLAPLIKLVEFPLPKVGDGSILPEGAEATVDIPSENVQYLKLACDLLQHPIKEYIAHLSPDWIITDFFSYWAVDIGREFCIPVLYFSILSAAEHVFLGKPGAPPRPPEAMTSPPDWVTFPSTVALRGFEVRVLYPAAYTENASGIADVDRVIYIMSGVRAIAERSCMEFEGEYINLFANLTGKPVIPVGFLPDLENPEEEEESKDGLGRVIFKWLGQQKPKSVVFVGFGSECKLTKDQVLEIAYGLQLSELPYLWALRKPHWAVEDADVLPPGFTDRTSGKGMVFMGWAPQVKILAHPSVGGSLFHSGWSSVIETLQFGHPLVVLPLALTQGLCARLAVDKGVAVEIDRNEDGSFSRDDIAKCLRLAMVSEEGEKLRARAAEASLIFRDPKLHQGHYIGELVEYLKKGLKSKIHNGDH